MHTSVDEPRATLRRAESSHAFRRWILPVFILTLGTIAVAVLLLSDRIEGAFRFPSAAAVVVAMWVLLGLWLLFLSELAWPRRGVMLLIVVGVPVCSLLTLHHYFRREGSLNGSGLPRFIWRHQPSRSLALLSATATTGRQVDLTPTPADFPRFLGPNGNNTLTGIHLWRDWSTSPPKLLWRHPIGLGWGSFSIVNGFAFTIEQRGGYEVTTCLDAHTGQTCWQHNNRARFTENMGGNGPRSTPTVAEGRVYSMGATGRLDCLDGATGKVLWTRNVLSDAHAENLQWGKSASPLVVDDLVVVTGGAAAPALLAYHRRTGVPAWTAGNDAAAYASPAIATLGGRRQLLDVTAHGVGGFDPASGSPLWNYPWPGDWPKASQPVPVGNDKIFISAGYGLGSSVLQLNGSGTAVHRLWNSRHLKTEFSNVAIRDGFVYGLDDGVLTCLELSSGNRQWRDGRYGHGQILLVDDLILVQAEAGSIALVEATPTSFNELATCAALSSKTWNCPALSGHLLLVRNDQEAAAFELP